MLGLKIKQGSAKESRKQRENIMLTLFRKKNYFDIEEEEIYTIAYWQKFFARPQQKSVQIETIQT